MLSILNRSLKFLFNTFFTLYEYYNYCKDNWAICILFYSYKLEFPLFGMCPNNKNKNNNNNKNNNTFTLIDRDARGENEEEERRHFVCITFVMTCVSWRFSFTK